MYRIRDVMPSKIVYAICVTRVNPSFNVIEIDVPEVPEFGRVRSMMNGFLGVLVASV